MCIISGLLFVEPYLPSFAKLAIEVVARRIPV